MVFLSKCLVCSSRELSVLFSCTDHFLSGEEFPLVRCNECGFIFTQNQPEENETAKYYRSEQYISHSDTKKGVVNTLYRVARKFMLKRKAGLIRKVTGKQKGKLLDIGCGTGHFAAEIRNSGWYAEGIEINEGARSFAERHFGLKVYEPAEINTLKSSEYDCITLWHVLEHFSDIGSYMREIRRLLKPGGLCLIALPNCSSFDALHYGEYWAAWDVPRHLWHFTPSTFEKYCDKSTFSVTNINSLPLDAIYISLLSEKYIGKKLSFLRGVIKGKWFFLKSLFDKGRSSSIIYTIKSKN